ncbi:MAG: CBS domain-containing protein [Dokdonella sp.]
MSTPIVSIDPETSVRQVLELAANLEIHHFPIVDARGLYGIVCTCDLASAGPDDVISVHAHRRIVTVSPQSSARDAAARMSAHQVGSVVIADEEGIWGILTREDLAETVPELMRYTQCRGCGTRQHLRHRPNGSYVCPSCAANEARRDPE